jgi:hypothetical protein
MQVPSVMNLKFDHWNPKGFPIVPAALSADYSNASTWWGLFAEAMKMEQRPVPVRGCPIGEEVVVDIAPYYWSDVAVIRENMLLTLHADSFSDSFKVGLLKPMIQALGQVQREVYAGE